MDIFCDHFIYIVYSKKNSCDQCILLNVYYRRNNLMPKNDGVPSIMHIGTICIVSSWKPCVMGRPPITGIMHGKITVPGRARHSQLPDPVCTAILPCVTRLWSVSSLFDTCNMNFENINNVNIPTNYDPIASTCASQSYSMHHIYIHFNIFFINYTSD